MRFHPDTRFKKDRFMIQHAENLVNALLELPEAERWAIADLLYESRWNSKLNSADAAAWQAFLDERIAEADRGDFAEGTADDVIQRAHESLAQGQE